MSPGGRLGRRRFLGLAGGAGAAVVAGVGVGRVLPATTSTGAEVPSSPVRPVPFTRPLVLPPVLRPVALGPDHDRYRVTAREADAAILPGRTTRVWGYDGVFPGPTVESRRGRAVHVEHANRLPVPTVVHLHGGRTPPESDGFPTDLVLPEQGGWDPHAILHHDPAARVALGAREHVFPNDQPATMLWYHDHRMDFTGPAVYRGLAGLHLVRDEVEDALPLPRDDRELPLMITDRSFTGDGAFAYPSVDPTLRHTPGVTGPYLGGVLGDVVLVNGVPWPVHDVAAVRHRLRLLNASNARRYELALEPPPPSGPSFVQIGADQGLLHRSVAHESITTAPAERHDVLVDFGAYPVGTEVTLVNRLGRGSAAVVMRFRVARRGVEESAVPAAPAPPAPPDAAPLRREDAVVTREFAFRAGQVNGRDGWVVGGLPFAAGRPDARPGLGDVEVWRLTADLHHPVHLHLVDFRVLTRGGGAPGPLDAGPKDTVDLRPGETVEILTRFEGHRGRYVVHCHNTEHEDMGMMATFEVV